MKKMENIQKHLPEIHKAGKVIFVIITDGLENSSVEYTHEIIRNMIEAKKECGNIKPHSLKYHSFLLMLL